MTRNLRTLIYLLNLELREECSRTLGTGHGLESSMQSVIFFCYTGILPFRRGNLDTGEAYKHPALTELPNCSSSFKPAALNISVCALSEAVCNNSLPNCSSTHCS